MKAAARAAVRGAAAVVLLLAAAGAAAQTLRERCLADAPAVAAASCRDAAQALDGRALLQLGQELQARGRAELAVSIYDSARQRQPDDRALLQALIRARAQTRTQRWADGADGAAPPPLAAAAADRASPAGAAPAVASAVPAVLQAAAPAAATAAATAAAAPFAAPAEAEPSAARNTSCWTARLQEALGDCRRELAQRGESAALLERIGDLQRNLGQGREALAAYTRSAALDPRQPRAQRKIGALSAVLGSAPAPLLPAAPIGAATTATAATATAPAAPPAPAQDARAGAGADAGQSYALVIGNNRYRAFTPLVTAVADAKLVGDVLRSRYGFKVETLENASRHEIIEALARLRRSTTEADSVLLYYAGHGILDEKIARGYWLPVDAQPDNVANWVSSHDIADLVSALPARHALIVSDSCFSGALARAGLGVALDERGSVLQRLAAKRSRTVLTSGGLEPVLDSGAGKHSVFARAFVDALTENAGPLEAARLFFSLRERVARSAEQTPQYAQLHDAGHHGGDFVFVPTAARAEQRAAVNDKPR